LLVVPGGHQGDTPLTAVWRWSRLQARQRRPATARSVSSVPSTRPVRRPLGRRCHPQRARLLRPLAALV